MAPSFSRPAELTEEARRIFFIVDCFLQNPSTHKPSPALERFPPSFESTPWRRIYMAMGAHSAAYLTMEPWDPSELSSGSARGIFWFFTEFPLIGRKICRKTVDGLHTWSGRSGRGPKNGFPIEILVAKLVIKGTAYHMLELTLDKEKPTVSLCKIWRMGTAAAESPQTKNQGTSTSNQVEDNLEAATDMQIDQPQGQFEGIEQQLRMPNHEMSTSDYTVRPKFMEHDSSFTDCWNTNHIIGQLDGKEQQLHVPGHALSTSDYVVHAYSTGGRHEGTEQQLHIPHHAMSTINYTCHPNYTCGRLEGIEQESHMPDKAVPPNSLRGQLEGVEEDLLSMSGYVVLPTSTEDFIRSTTGQDDGSVYMGAVSYLYEERESVRHIVSRGGNEAHEIVSNAQSLASAVKSLLNRFTFLGINTEPEDTRPACNTFNSNQLRTATNNSGSERATMPAPGTTTQDEFPEQERRQQMEGWCFIDDEDNFLS